MSCQGKTNKSIACTAPAQKYGVCGRHWKQACLTDGDTKVLLFISEYTPIVKDIKRLTNLALAQNLDISSIRPYVGKNLRLRSADKHPQPLLQQLIDHYVAGMECVQVHQNQHGTEFANKEVEMFMALIFNLSQQIDNQILAH